MAIVYRAFDLRSHQTVALKVLREEYEEDPEYRERFKREAEVCRKLNHPNIVNMIASGNVGGVSYIAMEYVDGKTLKELIAENGKMEQGEAIRCTLQILAALAHAHQRGVIHRDVKPQNVLVSSTGQLKIGDFGIAGLADSKTLTSDGNVMGSVHYFSPEQAKGMKATAASDLYSVGIILYEMLAGHVPFEGETAVSVAMMHLMEQPKSISEEAVVCPALAMIVAKSLEKQPQHRYQSADNMTRDLRRALRHPDGEFMQQRAAAANAANERKRGGSNKKKNLPAVLAITFFSIALLAIIGAAGWELYSSMFLYTNVPDLSGLDESSAQRITSGAGLVPSLSYVYSDAQEGYVSTQIPRSGEKIRRGNSVEIVISLGSGTLLMPKLTGLTQDEAMSALMAQGFTAEAITIEISEKPAGTVIAQSPEVGERVDIGAGVELVVSGGRVIVPELTGLRLEEAAGRIADVGLAQGTVTSVTVSDARQDGLVLSQYPDKLSEIRPGSVIDMTVGYYDKRKYKATVMVGFQTPEDGVNVRVTLVGSDGKETDMYSADHTTPGSEMIEVTLRSEESGVFAWRLYLDGSFQGEATAVLE